MGDHERWRDPAAYLYGLALNDPEWAWEFLRRNRRFRDEVGPPTAAAAVGAIGKADVTDPLAVWGLHFRARPRHAGRPCRRRLETGLAR